MHSFDVPMDFTEIVDISELGKDSDGEGDYATYVDFCMQSMLKVSLTPSVIVCEKAFTVVGGGVGVVVVVDNDDGYQCTRIHSFSGTVFRLQACLFLRLLFSGPTNAVLWSWDKAKVDRSMRLIPSINPTKYNAYRLIIVVDNF